MNVDKHVLFLIVIVGVISAGLVAATMTNHDSTMKQEVFDGIKVSVPSDSHFVKAGEGYYKDDVNGITIKTFKNNNSMVDYLKNLKKSKVIALENQPPQSVAFETGDLVSVLVTNGKEGVSVTTKDGKLTSEIANNIVFSDNHKTQKSKGIGVAKPHMNPKQDFNLIMFIVADVDTDVFNVAILEQNNLLIVDQYNIDIDSPIEDGEESVSDMAESEDMSTIVSDDKSDDSADSATVETIDGDDSSKDSDSASTSDDDSSSDSDTVETISSDDTSSSDVVGSSEDSSDDDSESVTPSSSSSSSSTSDSSSTGSSGGRQKVSIKQCEDLIKEELGPKGFSITKHEDNGDEYVFFMEDSEGEDAGTIVFDAYTGQADTTNFNK